MKLSVSQKVNAHHAAVQGFFWGGFSAIWSYVTVLLLYIGFSNTQIGTITGAALIVSIFLQPLLSAAADRRAAGTSRRMALLLCGVCAVITAALWLSLHRPFAAALCLLCIGTLLHIIAPFFGPMVMEYQQRGIPVNFGLGRGIGSAVYATVSIAVGSAVERFAPTLVVPVFAGFLLLEVLALWTFRYPLPPPEIPPEEKPPVISTGKLIKKYPAFSVIIIGSTLLLGCHNTISTYLLHIVAKTGSGESMLGLILGISAYLELPGMALFKRLHRRFSLRALFRFSSVILLLRSLTFFLAGGPLLLYAGAALQFAGYAVFLPCTVHYVAEELDIANQVKGQGLIYTCSNSLGPAAITFLSGRIIDAQGVNPMLLMTTLVSAAGAVIIWIATGKHFNESVE